MTDANAAKPPDGGCDTCGTTHWVFSHDKGWRCPGCMAKSLERLQAAVRELREKTAKRAANTIFPRREPAFVIVKQDIDALLQDHGCEEACEVLEKKGTENAS